MPHLPGRRIPIDGDHNLWVATTFTESRFLKQGVNEGRRFCPAKDNQRTNEQEDKDDGCDEISFIRKNKIEQLGNEGATTSHAWKSVLFFLSGVECPVSFRESDSCALRPANPFPPDHSIAGQKLTPILFCSRHSGLPLFPHQVIAHHEDIHVREHETTVSITR